jgi:monoamine oxidase
MQHCQTLIIGGGLAGTYAAYKMQNRKLPYLLLEAQAQLGGRILGQGDNLNSQHYYDLGPTWVFPHQSQIQSLISQLDHKLYEQYATGDVLYHTYKTAPPKRVKGAGYHQLYKIVGGAMSMINALQSQLDDTKVKLKHELTGITRVANQWQVSVLHAGIEQRYAADQLILAMPPRIIAKYLLQKSWLSNALVNNLTLSQTWMSAQAKFLVSYPTAFWREQGLSGQLFSQVGPMIEVHDGSASNNQNYALFGFIGWPHELRNKMSEDQIKQACIQQLIECFGDIARDYTQCFLKDWGQDTYITTEQDRTEPSRHPSFQLAPHINELKQLNLHFVGSEFAQNDAGYLEGAIDAVDCAFKNLHS